MLMLPSLALLLCLVTTAPNNAPIEFEILGLESGLSNSGGTCVFQDAQGFIWIGTQSGLNRYDGKRIKIYRYQAFEEDSLSENWISALAQTDPDSLWVATRSSGLNLLSLITGKVSRFQAGKAGKGALPSNIIWTLYSDENNRLWIGTDKGLVSMTPAKGNDPASFKLYAMDEENLQGNAVNAIVPDGQGKLWLGTFGNGLQRFDPVSGKFSRQEILEDGKPSRLADAIKALARHDDGLLIGTWGSGLLIIDDKGEILRHYHHQPQQPNSISGDVIQTIQPDSFGNIWLGTRSSGMCRIHPDGTTITRFKTQDDGDGNLGVWVNGFTVDRSNVLWVASGNGIGHARLNPKPFHYISDLDLPLGNTRVLTKSISFDPQGRLWIGRWRDGAMRVDFKKKATHHFPESQQPGSLRSGDVYVTYHDRAGRTWMGTRYGLHLFKNEQSGFVYFSDDTHGLSGKNISAIQEWNKDVLWVGTYGRGLNRIQLNPDGSVVDVRYFFADLSKPDALIQDIVSALAVDDQNRLWVATHGGLCRLDQDPGTDGLAHFKHFVNRPEDPSSLGHNQIGGLFVDQTKRLWVGTWGGGLNLFLSDEAGFSHFFEEDGVSLENIWAITQDLKGNLWLGNSQGLVRFNPDKNSIRCYNDKDGIRSSSFTCAVRGPGGNIYFGSEDDLLIFDPEQIVDNTHVPPIVLTRFKKFNEEVAIPPQGTAPPSIELRYNERIFSLTFAVLDFQEPDKNSYAYSLNNNKEGWVMLGNQSEITFNNLESGTHLLQVKGANNDGLWNPEPFRVAIHVLPPPWRTGWAYFAYCSLGIGIVLAGFRRQRTKLNDERLLNDKLRAMDRLKDEFLANTSHELRTPLNGIIGLADSMLEGIAGQLPDPARQRLALIVASGNRLSNLVNDLLDFSRLKHESLSLSLKAIDLRAVVEVVLIHCGSLAGRKNLVLRNLVPHQLPSVLADENRLQQILYNLVGNAIKFTESGTVDIAARLEKDQVSVSVRDTGIGIDPAHHDRIFQSFQQADGSVAREYGGTGLGLTVTKKLVNLHGGQIKLESSPGRGSTFSFTLYTTQQENEEGSTIPPLTPSALSTQAVPILTPENTQPQETPVIGPQPPNSKRQDFDTKPHILVVDDEPINRMVLANYLTLENYNIDEVGGGSDALQCLEKNPHYDLVLLDVMMPRMSGYEVCNKIRQAFPVQDLPVIFLSAKNQPKDITDGFDSGANDYLSKPIVRGELLARVRTHLALRDINRNLEKKVEERTAELERRNQEILETKARLAHQEKMAALGRLTAGVAHHMNTPVGVVKTALSYLEEQTRRLAREFDAGELTEESLARFISSISESSGLMERNLERAIHLVHSFKLLAVEEDSLDIRSFELAPLVRNVLLAHFPDRTLGEQHVRLGFPNNLVLKENPQVISIILDQLVSNSLAHAFPNGIGQITISWTVEEGGGWRMVFEDDGRGLPADQLATITEPFVAFGQNRGAGLGLHLVYNRVTESLGGQMHIQNNQPGLRIIIEVPSLDTRKQLSAKVGQGHLKNGN